MSDHDKRCELVTLTVPQSICRCKQRQLERELAAYQAEMPREPEAVTAWRNREQGKRNVHLDYMTALAKRCAGLTVELEAAQCPIGISTPEICSAGTCLTCLQARLKAERKDAERYRWLRGDNESEFGDPWCVTRKIPADMLHEPHALSYEELDAAIDAALAAGKEKGKL